MARLEGKVAFITGAASGIGAACALRFAQEGARIAGVDLEASPQEDWKQAAELAPQSLLLEGDVRSDARMKEVADEVASSFGQIDVLVNSAGVAGGGAIHQIDEAAWDQVVDVNLKGTFLASKHVIPHMIERRSGSVIHVASVEGLEGFAGGSSYNASKGGVVLLGRNMAIDYARLGIRVNTICPGFIETPMFRSVFEMPGVEAIRDEIREAHQLGRFGQPREIAQAALFLASDEASFVTGVALPVDGGYTAGHRFSTARMMGLE